MYPFGTGPRFITPRSPTDVAFYAEADIVLGPKTHASYFSKSHRQMIHKLGASNNPCKVYYNP